MKESSGSGNSSAGNQGAVTRGAHLGILAPQPLRVEARSVGVEPAPAQGRVARETVALHVARGAALQALPRGLAVRRPEEPAHVVIARPERAGALESGGCVAGRAEGARAVAVAAPAFARVRRRRVPREKAGGVVARPGRGARPVA